LLFTVNFHHWAIRSLLVLTALIAASLGASAVHRPVGAVVETYDSTVLQLRPYAYYHVSGTQSTETDLAGDHPGNWTQASRTLRHVRLPNGTQVVRFEPGDYLTVPSATGFSIPTTGQFTVIAWLDPSTLQFSAAQGSGYVHWLGKGDDGAQEWTLRMYSLVNAENRPNRISGYVFNPDGGKGSGAYFQDPVAVGKWIMVGFEVTTKPSRRFPTGWVAISKDGLERARVGLDQFGVTPHSGAAPVRIGTRDLESFFQGGIGDVAIFDRLIPSLDMQRLYAAMIGVERSRN
jgi:hypothetical protein